MVEGLVQQICSNAYKIIQGGGCILQTRKYIWYVSGMTKHKTKTEIKCVLW